MIASLPEGYDRDGGTEDRGCHNCWWRDKMGPVATPKYCTYTPDGKEELTMQAASKELRLSRIVTLSTGVCPSHEDGGKAPAKKKYMQWDGPTQPHDN